MKYVDIYSRLMICNDANVMLICIALYCNTNIYEHIYYPKL